MKKYRKVLSFLFFLFMSFSYVFPVGAVGNIPETDLAELKHLEKVYENGQGGEKRETFEILKGLQEGHGLQEGSSSGAGQEGGSLEEVIEKVAEEPIGSGTGKQEKDTEISDELVKDIVSGESDIGEVEDKLKASTEYIQERIERVKQKLGINNTTLLEQEFNTINKELSDADIETLILKELIEKSKEKENKNKAFLEANRESIEKLEAEIKTILENNNQKSSEVIGRLKGEVEVLKEKEEGTIEENEELKNTIKLGEIRLQGLLVQIKELQLYKQKYEEKLLEEQKAKNKEILSHIIIYVAMTAILIVLLIGLKFLKAREKQGKKSFLKNIYVYDVLLWILYVLGVIIYTLIIYPQVGLVFLFLGSGILFSLRPILSSFFSSISIITSYNIGDIIKVGETTGKIIRFSPLNISLEEVDINQIPTRKLLKIPNNTILEKEVGKIKENVLKKDMTFILKIAKGKKDILSSFLQDIDKIFKKYKTKENKVKYFYSSSMKGSQELEIALTYYYEKKGDMGMNLEKDLFFLIQENYLIEKGEE